MIHYAPFLIIAFYALIPLSIILTLMGIYNIMTNHTNDSILRLIWVIILIFIPFFGFLFYLFIGIKQLKNA
jgi:hypothetical protein